MAHSLFKRAGTWASLAMLAGTLAAGSAVAATVIFSGNLGDPANTALVASDLSSALFADDLATANNVAMYTLSVAVAGDVSFASTGFASGGIDPYFTLFSGTDRATATVLDSNYVHATTVGGDFSMTTTLAAGDYTVALSAFENLSFAENLGAGVLAEGFTALGGPSYFGDGSYVFTVNWADTVTPVPEPSTGLLSLTAAAAVIYAIRRRKNPNPQGEK